MTSQFNAKAARAKRPCPLWVDAFQRDTQHLGADEVGAYMLILMAMWTRESCDFPDDDRRLAQVARVSLRLWTSRIGPVVKAFFKSADGVVTSKRLREEATYVEREVQNQSDRKRGTYAKPTVSSVASKENDENSDKSLKYNDQASTVDDPQDGPRHYPSQQPNIYGGGGVARACEREADPPRADDLIWRILHVIGFDRGQIIPKYWTTPDAPLIVQRWRDDLGLTDDQIVEVSRLNAAQHSEPARGPKILVPAMQAYAAALHAPRLDPSTPTPNQNPGGKNDRHAERRAFDSTIHQLADGIAAGTVHIDDSSRDPWEYARRNGASGNPADGEHDAGPVFRP